jgi:gamma-glutamylcysteine synthetase
MKPTILTEPSLLVPAHVAAWLGLLVDAVKTEARRDRLILPTDVVETLDKLRLLGDECRQGKATKHGAASPPSPPASWTSVELTSDILDISTQAVTGLCRRHTLHAEQQDDRSWRVCRESATARLAGATCQHTNQENP